MKKRVSSSKINYKRLIKDFNILVEYSQTDRELYQQPDLSKLDQIYESSLLKNPQGQKYSLCCDIDEFKFYGPGIFLLFKFIKLLILLFAIVSLFAVVNIGLLSSGQQFASNLRKTNTFEAAIAKTTVGNIESNYSQVIPIIHFVGLVIFTAGIVFWKERQPYEVISCFQVKLLPSYYTVVLKRIPEGYSQSDMKSFLEEEFGEVKEIFSVKELKNDLFHYKEINEIVEEYKVQRSLVSLYRPKRNSLKMISLFNEFYNYYLKMKEHKRPRYQPASAFITFQDVGDRERLLAVFNSKTLQSCCNKKQENGPILYKGQFLEFQACKMEPDAIIWQNISLTTQNIILRIVFQITLLVIVLAISIVIIYLFALAQTNLIISKYSSYSREQIMQLKDEQISKYYCLGLSISDFFDDYQLCGLYQGLFAKIISLQIFLPIIISILKFLFTELMKYVVIVRRHSTEIKKLESQIIITFIFYFIISGVLQLLVNIQFSASSGNKISINRFFSSIFNGIYNLFPIDTSKISPYDDFTSQWYFTNSSKIVLICLVSFNLTSIFNIFYSVIRKQICRYMARKQQTHIQMSKCLKGEIIEKEFIYAFVLNIIFFTLLFGAVIPLLWIFGLITITVLYWAHKYIFTTYCQKPLEFSHSLNHLVIRFTLFGISLSCLISPILLGGVVGPTDISGRWIRFLYYPLLGMCILVYMFCKKYAIKAGIWFKDYFQSNGKVRKNRDRLPSIISRIDYKSRNLPSYSMHENKFYEPILKVLYTMNLNERNRGTFMMNQNLSEFLYQQDQEGEEKRNAFYELLAEIRTDQRQFMKEKSNSYINPFNENDRKIKEIIKIYKESRAKAQSQAAQAKRISQIVYPESQIDAVIEQDNETNKKGRSSDSNSNEEEMESERPFPQQTSIQNHLIGTLNEVDFNILNKSK